MTEPERPPGGSPGSPTPEEISARLEALLKRTHTLRTQRATAGTGGPLNMTWPPPDRELDHYDVVDVPDQATTPVAPAETPVTVGGTPEAETATAHARQDGGAGKPGDRAAEFARPDWSELRLRAPGDDHVQRSPWWWVLTTLLALAASAQAAYIWHLQSTRPAPASGKLRVDGPRGAEVRVNGQAIGAAPVDHALEPGGYTVEVVQPGGIATADDVIVGLGRTVVVMVAAPSATGQAETPATSAPPASGAPQVTPVDRTPPAPAVPTGSAPPPAATTPAAPPAGDATVSATMGAVRIDSTPQGLPVTMGGRPRGVTPVTVGLVRPGRHDVMVGSVMRQVDITAGEVATLRVP